MGITHWVVVMVLFVSINMMPLHITLFQALLQDNSQIKQEQCIFGSSGVLSRDNFNPDFADGQRTHIQYSSDVTLHSCASNLLALSSNLLELV